jgi:Fe-Mn family superoxide dismutase
MDQFKSEIVVLVQIGFMENSLGGALRGGIVYGEEQAAYLQLLTTKAAAIGLETSCLHNSVMAMLTDKQKGDHILLCGQAWIEQSSFFLANFMIAGQLSYQILRNRYGSDNDLPETKLKNILCGEYLKLGTDIVHECIAKLKQDRTTCLSCLQTFLLGNADHLASCVPPRTLAQENQQCLQLVYIGFYYGLLLLVLQTGQSLSTTQPGIRFGAVLLRKLESLAIPAEYLFSLEDVRTASPAEFGPKLMGLFAQWGDLYCNYVDFLEFGFALSILQIYVLDNKARLPLNPEEAVRCFCVDKLQIRDEVVDTWVASCSKTPDDIAYNIVFDWVKDFLSISATVYAGDVSRFDTLSMDSRFKSFDTSRFNSMATVKGPAFSLDDSSYREEADFITRESTALEGPRFRFTSASLTAADRVVEEEEDVGEDAPLVDDAIKFRRVSVVDVDLRKSALSFGRLSLVSTSYRPSILGGVGYTTRNLRPNISRDNGRVGASAAQTTYSSPYDSRNSRDISIAYAVFDRDQDDMLTIDERSKCRYRVFEQKIELPALPFPCNALAPYLDAETVRIHHSKHHAKYVANTRALIAGTPFQDADILTIIQHAHRCKDNDLFNNAAQCFNHSFYWQCMGPLPVTTDGTLSTDAGGPPSPNLRITAYIRAVFGSFDALRAALVSTAMNLFGSGWVWLVWDTTAGTIRITKTAGAGNPLVSSEGQIPLLAIDIWEHSYYLDYQSSRIRYVEAFVNRLVNWKFVDDQLPGFAFDVPVPVRVGASPPPVAVAPGVAVAAPLPYAFDALAPYIIDSTLQTHYHGHYRKCVLATQRMIANSALQDEDLMTIIRVLHRHQKQQQGEQQQKQPYQHLQHTSAELLSNAVEAWNHLFYFQCMCPPELRSLSRDDLRSLSRDGMEVNIAASRTPNPVFRISSLINQSFGNHETFRNKFIEAGMSLFGSGWLWLVLHKPSNSLIITTTTTEGSPGNPLTKEGQVPLLTIDLWEHAYYLTHENQRLRHLEVFLDHLIHWQFVEDQLAQSMQSDFGVEPHESATVPRTPASPSGVVSEDDVTKEGVLMKKARIRGMWSFMSYLVPRPWAQRKIELHRSTKVLKYFHGDKFKDEVNITGYEARLVRSKGPRNATTTNSSGSSHSNPNSRANSSENITNSGGRSMINSEYARSDTGELEITDGQGYGAQSQSFALFDQNGVEVILFSAATKAQAEEWVDTINEVARS